MICLFAASLIHCFFPAGCSSANQIKPKWESSHVILLQFMYVYTWNPNDPCFYCERPCFGGLQPNKIGALLLFVLVTLNPKNHISSKLVEPTKDHGIHISFFRYLMCFWLPYPRRGTCGIPMSWLSLMKMAKPNGIWRRLPLVMNILPQLSFQIPTWNFKCAIFWYHFCSPTISPVFFLRENQKIRRHYFVENPLLPWWKLTKKGTSGMKDRSMALDQYKSRLKRITVVRMHLKEHQSLIVIA